MIIPVVCEREWLEHVGDLPAWRPSAKRIVLVAPHPDDETLAAGGLIAAQRALGVEVVVVAVTEGENAYAENDGLAALRSGEQTAALEVLGVPSSSVVRLKLIDSGVKNQQQKLAARLLPMVSSNTHVIAPWRGDFHPDHEACGLVAAEVAGKTGAELTSYFFWTWHRGTPAILRNLNLRSFPLDEKLLAQKQRALACHRSQLMRDAGDPILPESLLAPARRPFEVFSIA